VNNRHHHGVSYPGSVLLELGGGAGALIVHTGPERRGEEIEITSVTGDGVRTHAEVRERRMPDTTVYCAVYYGLAAGDYTVAYGPGLDPSVTIASGAVTELRPARSPRRPRKSMSNKT
jgi:hypothetical protein